MAKGRLVLPPFTVIRDSREKAAYGWTWDAEKEDAYPPRCIGTEIEKLDVGDYSIRGYEDVFCIERKADISELWMNYADKTRFEDELIRMQSVPHRFIIVESVMSRDLFYLSPPQFQKGVPGKALQEWLSYLMIKYQTPILFEGDSGRRKAMCLMKQIVRIFKDRWERKYE